MLRLLLVIILVCSPLRAATTPATANPRQGYIPPGKYAIHFVSEWMEPSAVEYVEITYPRGRPCVQVLGAKFLLQGEVYRDGFWAQYHDPRTGEYYFLQLTKLADCDAIQGFITDTCMYGLDSYLIVTPVASEN